MHADHPNVDLAEIAERVGVTRIADLTALDDLGVCVAAAVRTPLFPESISVCSGRGTTPEEARQGAIAEAIERYCAEPRGRIASVVTATPTGERIPVAQLSPAEVPSDDDAIEWVRGTRVRDGAPIWIPAEGVFYPYPNARWFAPATHGLAAGRDLDDAVRRGLLECIERDAYARAVALATLGHDHHPAIDPAFDDATRATAVRLSRRGLSVLLRDITGGTAVPTVLATIAEDVDGQLWAHRGCAADADARRAGQRALLEAVQGRLVDIQGAREDLDPVREPPASWFTSAGSSAAWPRSLTDDRPAELARRLCADGCGDAAFVDLSLAGCPLRVVRVVVPGLEVWADDPSRAGPRLEAWCRAV